MKGWNVFRHQSERIPEFIRTHTINVFYKPPMPVLPVSIVKIILNNIIVFINSFIKMPLINILNILNCETILTGNLINLSIPFLIALFMEIKNRDKEMSGVVCYIFCCNLTIIEDRIIYLNL